jgi:two-component system NtrC family sensor kinase
MDEPKPTGRILIIDDQEPTRYVFRRILARAGFRVEEAATGREGLEKSLTYPDLIIADVNLPDMLGYDVCRRLKANPLTINIPVLQISASFISDESKAQALEGGADSYLTQPVEPLVLIASVNALLRLRRAEVQSHLSALQWQTTFDSLTDGLALADAHGVVTRTNSSLVHMLGVPASELEGKPMAAIFDVRFDFTFDTFMNQRSRGHSAEHPLGKRWVRIRYDEIQTEYGSLSGSVLILTDITDHKKLQETLKLSERLAATGRLAHIIAHEINNPLEAMSNLLFLAEQDTTGYPETQRYIQQASTELIRISQITKQVLAYHRESKQPMLTSANEVLSSVIAMFRAHVGGMGVALETRFGCNQDLLVNPGEIHQVFSNIISNALDAIAPSHGKLKIRCLRSRDIRTNLPGVRFLFSDNGSGVDPSAAPHIFEAFYTTKEAQGSGIGLWLSAEMIEKHKGRIRMRTRTRGPYRGTLFDIFLPTPHA